MNLKAIKYLFALLTIIVLSNGWDVVWGFLTPGDYFGNGSSWLLPSLVICIIFGAVLGRYIQAKIFQYIIYVLLIGCIYFWIFTPDGWWVKPIR
jgi:hypothetical protein